jgi:hypothetical protein
VVRDRKVCTAKNVEDDSLGEEGKECLGDTILILIYSIGGPPTLGRGYDVRTKTESCGWTF